jgi:hypothetical protein
MNEQVSQRQAECSLVLLASTSKKVELLASEDTSFGRKRHVAAPQLRCVCKTSVRSLYDDAAATSYCKS